MAALTKPSYRATVSNAEVRFAPLAVVKDTEEIFRGAVVALDSSGEYVNYVADSGHKVQGVFMGLDQSVVGDGVITTDTVRRQVIASTFCFANDADDPVTAGDTRRTCYFVDNNSVSISSASGDRHKAGIVVLYVPETDEVVVDMLSDSY